MQNTTIANPHVAMALANDHQQTLLDAAHRSRRFAPTAPGVARRAVGAFLMRAGARVSGCSAGPALTPRHAA